jgi:hypothetical protein
MGINKLTFNDKTNLYPFVDRDRQICAEDINELKTKFNDNIDENFNRSNTPQLGYKLLADDFDFASIPADYDNSIWEIRKVYDLDGAAVVIPENVTLKFIGGKLTNYISITGDNTKISAGIDAVFDASGDLIGTWKIDKSFPQWFGAVGDGVANDTIPLQKMLNIGGKCYVPDGEYLFSLIELAVNGTHLVLSNNAVLSSNVSLANAIEVSADNCIIEGGSLNMTAVFDATNTQWLYANIYVTGANVKIKEMTLNNVQKVGIGFKGTSKCYVEGCTINGNYGGPWTEVETAHFGITWDAGGTGGTFVVTGCTINSCVQGVYVGNYGAAADETGIMLTNNAISRCFNHGIYCGSGEGQVISGNNIYYCGVGIAAKTDNGAVLNGNMIYLGKETPAVSNVVGMSLRECKNTVVTGNNIIGDGEDSSGALVIQNFSGSEISGNVITGNNIKLTRGISCNAIHLGSSAYTTLMFGNIIANNYIETGCNEFQGGILVRSFTGAVCYNNIISGNIINFEVQRASDAAIYVFQTPNMTIRDNIINIEGNSTPTITAFAIDLKTSSYAEIVNNKISCQASNGGNINLNGVRIESDSLACRAEGNKADTSLSNLLTTTIVYSFAADTEIKKNINNSRIATSGIATIPAGQRHVYIPWQNCNGYGGTSGVPIKNVLVRPINNAAWTEMNTQILNTVMYTSNADLIFPLNVAADCVFGWEIV